ncbi:MAG: carbohydrate ABC transporter permease [Oscillospiraceae bacterium]|jgi:multiple sugar transport system permease protein/putative aldouronate transport system permease protein|nr:carbohydrate ABC transporter permease [Oscillospiraceae bacterium]
MMKIKNESRHVKITGSDRIFHGAVAVILTAFLLLVLYPLIYVLSSSFSSGNAVTSGRVMLWPVEFSLNGYQIVFANNSVWTGYMNTIFYTVVGTLINLSLTVLTAYPLSRKTFQGRKFFTIIFMIPMFFGGGLVPTYVLMSNLGLTNTRTVILLSGAISIYNMVLMRTFFQNSIPNELLESAKIDGISDVGYLVRIVLPLSKAIISVITLYYVVGHWNSYFTPLIYLRSREFYPLQLILREILNASKVDATQIQDSAILAKLAGSADVMKYSLIVVATVPVLVIYPFIQKFFEKGVMIGSVKG